MADDYERQFQADLERAAALSMETLALEEFKRKQRNSGGSVQRSSRNSMTGDQLDFHRASSSAPQDLSRRRSEVLHSSATAPDLISFSGPDPNPVDLMSNSQGGGSGQTPVQDKHTSFVQYVGQIHQISTQQQQYLAGVRTANAAITPFTPIPVAGPDGMQLMPYRPAATPTTQPLTPDNLQKLYNSAYYPTGYSRFPSQFITTPQAVVPLANVPYATTQQQMRSASVPPSSKQSEIRKFLESPFIYALFYCQAHRRGQCIVLIIVSMTWAKHQRLASVWLTIPNRHWCLWLASQRCC